MWFQPANVRDNLLITTVDTKSNFWLKTNTIFFLYEFDLSLFTLQYNHVISIFKNIIIDFHEDTQNASDIEFAKRHARRSRDLRQNYAYEFGFAQVRGQNKIHIAEIQLFFPNCVSQHDLN